MTLRQDVRLASRRLVGTPTFTLGALLTLAICIATTTTIFGVVNQVLIRPLPLPDSSRLVTFWHGAPSKGLDEINLNDALFAFYRTHRRQFADIAAYEAGRFVLAGTGEPDVLTGARVTFNYFDVLGQAPRVGRPFLPREGERDRGDVAIISHGLWQRRFGGNPGALGRVVKLNDRPTTVVGIMPEGFDFPNPSERPDLSGGVQLWVPKPINPDDISSWNLLPVARLNAMVSLDEGRREIDELWRDFLEDFGPRLGDGGLGSDAVTVMTTLHQRIVGDSRSALLVLFAGAGIVLLIACANLANLFLIRAWARRREMAVRRSLGATSRQLMRPILVESTLLALLGGTVGFGVAYWGLAIVKGVAPSQIPRIALVEIDWLVALFALAVTALVALVCGLIPAVRCREVGLVEVVNLGPRGTTAGTSGRYNEAFAIAQLALSLVLLIAAALLVQSFRNLTATDPGFRSQNLLMGQIPSVPVTRYPSNVQVRAFYERLLDGVHATPGVQAAELSQVVPFSGGGGGAPFTVEGFEPKAGEAAKVSWWRAVTPGYFAAIGSPVIRGRPFVAADTETSLPVAIVDEKLARMHSPDRNVVGKRVRVGQGPWMTIVGVVASMKNRRLNEESMPYPYQPFAQRIRREMMLVVRSTVDPAALVPSIRRHMASLDPEQPIFSIMTLDEAVGRAVAPARTTNVLLGLFAAAAFGLAIIGLYAVMSLNVSGRLNEFGIRLALGGHPRSVRWLVVGRSLKLVGIPLAGGLIGASAATRALQGLLFGVQPTDPAIFISVSAFLAGIAMAAAYVPAPRATKIDPLALLRYQ